MARTALISGVTGIVGRTLAQHLVKQGWSVIGLSRSPATDIPDITAVAADLTDAQGLRPALEGLRPTHLFLTSWSRQPSERENIAVNRAMVRNLLQALGPAGSMQHVALLTGLKHYLGPFETYGKDKPVTPFRESMPRLPIENFYYAQEDEVFEAAVRDGFSWSVHRSHTIIGHAIGNAMNMGTTLATYASICRSANMPFVFPGSRMQWECLVDMTDARLLARHLEWAATSCQTRNEALNIVNGDVFRWSWMWGRIAEWFGLEPEPMPVQPLPLSKQLAGAASVWSDIAARHQLVEPDLSRLSSAWHTDAMLSRPFETVTDMSKSRQLGFLNYQATDLALFDLFEMLVKRRVIPDPKKI